MRAVELRKKFAVKCERISRRITVDLGVVSVTRRSLRSTKTSYVKTSSVRYL